jgi:hypothetical protein
VRRRTFLGAAAAPLAGARVFASPSRVTVGLEQVVASKGEPLRGRRVGLLGHAASLTADGRHAIDALRDAGVRVVRLFGPEHGLRGQAAAGEKVASGVDGPSGLPVVSLYGERNKPTAEDLRSRRARRRPAGRGRALLHLREHDAPLRGGRRDAGLGSWSRPAESDRRRARRAVRDPRCRSAWSRRAGSARPASRSGDGTPRERAARAAGT